MGKRLPVGNYVGFPASVYLDQFGAAVEAVFGDWPYQVGSSLKTKAWRDVDVRLILPDDVYDRELGTTTAPLHRTAKAVVLDLAFSALGQRMTGLPIDFQIQRMTEANEDHPGPRSALGCTSIAVRRDWEKTNARKRGPK